MAVGGDIVEVTYNHPDLGSGTLFPKSGEESTYDLGGFRSDDEANGIDGGGNMIDVMKRARWSFAVPISWDMNVSGELEKVTAMAGSPVHGQWTFTHINGTVYSGTGKPVGEMPGNGGAATLALKISGGGTMKKI